MKNKNLFFLPTLIASLGLIPVGRLAAQTFTTLHRFTALVPYFTNSDGVFYNNGDGAAPDADLIVSRNTLYGTAYDGGNANAGTVFALNTDGTGFTILHKFTERSGPNYTNSDGAKPAAVLVLSGNTLFGTAAKGGSSGKGTVFAVITNGAGFTNLHVFTAFDSVTGTNSDGVIPYAGLILTNNTLYGTASGGGGWGNGTVFALNTDGSGFTNLHSFTALPGPDYTNSDGADPEAGLVLSGNTLYGTAQQGSSSGAGTVFSLSLPLPQLTITPSGANVVLTWPTNAPGISYDGFTLQSITNLASPAVWTTNSLAPVVVNGRFAVTNPAAGPQKFYRLSQ